MNESCRKQLLEFIYQLDFAVDDIVLYLDTHPCDQKALEYYKEYRDLRKEAIEEYAKYFGPIENEYVTGCDFWNWVKDPWPWEGECQYMWNYQKKLQYPVNITKCNPQMAQVIISQFGGPDGELAASMRYLSQRYAMPYREVAGTLTDIGTEELAHMEIISAIVFQLTRNLTPEEIKCSGFDKYYVDHTLGLWPQAAGGIPFNACEFQSKGDPITDLFENLAAEQKARSTYDNILRLIKDPEICDPIKFLREREIVHFQRFGESLRLVQEKLDSKNFYCFNPAFDKCCACEMNK